MMDDNKKTNAQLTKYFEKVITNTASNYYRKRRKIEEREIFGILLEELLIEQDMRITLPTMTLLNIPLVVENDQVEQVIKSLKEKEQIFLIEKFIFDKTDKDIGEILGMSRSGVTNLKLRLYNKFRLQL